MLGEKQMKEATAILVKPPVGGMDPCKKCGHYEWEHNVDIVVEGKIVRPKNSERMDDICQHEGSLRCCVDFCRKFE